jgi:predicted permease
VRRHREFIIGDLDELYAARRGARGRLSADLAYIRGVLASAFASRAWGVGAGPFPRRLLPIRWSIAREAVDDVAHAVRGLRRRPGFALLVMATLAVGVGPGAAVFGMIEQLLLRPVPGSSHTRRAAHLEVRSADGSVDRLSPLAFDELRARTTLLDGVASFGGQVPIASPEGGRSAQFGAATIHGDYFEVLGVVPSAGRLLAASETGADADPFVVVLSESLRDDLFGLGEDVVGRTLTIGGHASADRYPFEVVGVAGGGFRGLTGMAEADAWFPLSALTPLGAFPAERLTTGESTIHPYYLVLPHPGVPLAAAEAQVQGIVERVEAASGRSSESETPSTVRLHGGLQPIPAARDGIYSLLRTMAWAVLLILVVACANVANLLLFRSVALRGAVATRRALGASSGRIARQILAESAMLGIGGAMLGTAVAWLITLPFEGRQLGRMPALGSFTVDWAMLGVLVAIGITSAVAFGVVPAVLAARVTPASGLRASSPKHGGRLALLRSAISSGQLALTLALVVGALLMARSLSKLGALDTGVEVEGIVGVTIGVSSRYGDQERHDMQKRLLEALREVPEVEGAALDMYGPHGSSVRGRLRLPDAPDGDAIRATAWPVTPGWFELFRADAIHGRTFEDSDWRPEGNPGGVVLTASLARRLFGVVEVSGRAVLAGMGEPVERRILGVVDDYRSLASPLEATDAFFVPFDDHVDAQWTVFARTSRYDEDVGTRLVAAAESALPAEVAVHPPTLMQDRVERVHQEKVVLGHLLGILSAFALLLSSVGLFGVIAFTVSQRRRELGIRVALGADTRRILRLVMSSAATIVIVGVGAGLAGAYWLSMLLRSQLFEVEALDLTTHGVAAVLLAVVAALACLTPVRAALRVDPAATLREE